MNTQPSRVPYVAPVVEGAQEHAFCLRERIHSRFSLTFCLTGSSIIPPRQVSVHMNIARESAQGAKS